MSSKPRAEPGTDQAVRRIVPWVVSVGLHAGVVALGFFLTWTVINLGDEPDPVLVIADFDALSYDPLVSLETEPLTAEPDTPRRLELSESFERALAERLADLEPPPVALSLDGAAAPSLADFAPAPADTTATFVGLTTTNARRIVYVIDASGSMIRSLPIVIEELARSLENLSARQSYGVVFFQHNRALTVPPANRLSPATAEAKTRSLRWIDDHAIPAGRSNPLKALEKAIDLEPDVIFLLSENITGSGEFEIDQADLLELLDRLNPLDPDTGRRRTVINCVQFLDPDPIDTLRRIAERHGGPDGYKFLGRTELGFRE